MVCTHLDAFRTSNQHFPVILRGFPRFWGPSPAELPSKLERVSEAAQSEDLEDFDRILMNFPRIWSSAGAEPSSTEPERSSAEPEPSSAEPAGSGNQ